jgi:hypothetical protein
LNARDLVPCGFALSAIQLSGSGTSQPTVCAVHDGDHHLQIAQQFGDGSGRILFLGLPPRFEKQLWIIQNAFADRGRAFTPSVIQLAGFARLAMVLREDRGHPLAILQAQARHRHQKLHRDLRRDFAFAHLLLDSLRQKFRQCQSPRHPAHAPVESARQFIQPVAEALLQLGQ